jgi:hypothetical protein
MRVKMQRMRWILVIISAILFSALAIPSAFAQEISLICEDDNANYALGIDPVAIGAEVSCAVNPSEITAEGDGHIVVESPSGVTIVDQLAAESGTTVFDFTANEAGTFVITVTFVDSSQQEHQITGFVTASIDVIPESPIGMIAIVGSSLAVLGAFLLLRNKSSLSSQSTIEKM